MSKSLWSAVEKYFPLNTNSNLRVRIILQIVFRFSRVFSMISTQVFATNTSPLEYVWTELLLMICEALAAVSKPSAVMMEPDYGGETRNHFIPSWF